MSSSAIRELLKLTTQSDVISFAGGLPAPEVFPVAEFAEASTRVLKEFGAQALQYSTTEGYPPIRKMIARHAARFGIHISSDNILMTSGSQQALDLLGKSSSTLATEYWWSLPPTSVRYKPGMRMAQNTCPSR